MRLKMAPSDFRVREELSYVPSAKGDYYVHVLTKEKVDTLTALGIVAREAGVTRAEIAFAGLKDRQGRTEQWISIRGRRLDFVGQGVQVRYVGRSDEPVNSKMSGGNHFAIVARDMSPFEAIRVRRNLPAVRQSGFPNYFDDQRFGCLRHGQGFVMRELLLGHDERALAQILARPSPIAIAGDVKLKRALQRHWGDFETCLKIARGPIYERVFTHLLRNRGDFRGALALLPERMKLIHAFAYQSFLWNRAVVRLLLGIVPQKERLLLQSLGGQLVAWRYASPEVVSVLETIETPLYGADGDGGHPDFRRAMHATLIAEGLTEDRFRTVAIPGMFLKSEPRPLLVHPADLVVRDPAPDERNRGRMKIEFSFALPRGSYATLLLKRLFAETGRRGENGFRNPGEQDRIGYRDRPPHRGPVRGAFQPRPPHGLGRGPRSDERPPPRPRRDS